jgi:hypothetical protein
MFIARSLPMEFPSSSGAACLSPNPVLLHPGSQRQRRGPMPAWASGTGNQFHNTPRAESPHQTSNPLPDAPHHDTLNLRASTIWPA